MVRSNNKGIDFVSKVVEETHNEDFKLIEDFKRTLTAPENKSSPDVKRIGGKVLDGLMSRFQGFTKKISEKLSALLRKPEVKEKAKEPVKESILEQLSESREQADANNEARKREQALQPTKRNRTEIWSYSVLSVQR